MQISIIAVGKLKEKYWLQAQNEYVKRLRPYARMEIREVPDESFAVDDSGSILEKVKEKEGRKIIKALKAGSYVIALDLRGEELDSPAMARKIENLGITGKSHVTFLIGGTLGLSKEVLQAADYKLSFSRLTFPHQLMRIILLEQLFRAFKIIRNEPYHK